MLTEAPNNETTVTKNLPEITVKAVVLSIILTIVLAASNAYLGLKVGTTISASIPAAVISMGILRFFRRSNILENNIVQTAASAGEALVAGIAFILPALIILQIWTDFHYAETVMVAMVGGILGVLFSVPLRRILLADKNLPFPEGTAIGNVLKASAENKASVKYLLNGGIIGGLISLAQTGFRVLSEGMQFWYNSGSLLLGGGAGFSPALLAAGYIVGINVGLSILLGIITCWLIAVPWLAFLQPDVLAAGAAKAATTIWKMNVRYIGVGVMIVGGLWTLINLIKPIIAGLRSSMASVRKIRVHGIEHVPRTELDMPITYVFWGTLILAVPLFFIFKQYATPELLGISHSLQIVVLGVSVVLALLAGFIFSSICGYFTGLVGSTNNPLSAMTLASLILVSLVLLLILGINTHFALAPEHRMAAAALAIIICAVVACAATISNDTIQDLKAGQMVGATPWKQQVMLILGVIVAAIVIPLVLQLLFNAYGISGAPALRPGMNPEQMLAAPQASAMAVVVKGIFAHNLQWETLGIGAIIAVFFIALNALVLKPRGLSLPVLGLGLGIYLPLETTTPLVFGALTAFFVNRAATRRFKASHPADYQQQLHQGKQRGLILACGIVAGAALMGVLLAIPFAIAQSTDVWQLVPDSFVPVADGLSVIVTIALVMWFFRVVSAKK